VNSLKKHLGSIFSILTTLIVLLFVVKWLLKDTDIPTIWDILMGITSSSLVILILCAVFNIWIFQYPYMVTTKNLKFWQAFQVRNASFAISNSVPAGGTIGLSFQYAMLRSFGVSGKDSSATIGIASVWNGLISFFMPVLGLVSLTFSGEVTSGLIRSTIIGILILIISSGLFYTSLKSAQGAIWVGSLLSKVVNPIRNLLRKQRVNLSNSIDAFRLQVNDLVANYWKKISLTNFLVQIAMFLVFWASTHAVGINVAGGIVFAVFCFGRIGTTIPLTPGGLGTTDVIMVSMLQVFGADAQLSLAAVLLWRGFFYIPQVLAGLLSFLYWQLSRVK
jgi:uncharacterized protein (TIRG00374 family)